MLLKLMKHETKIAYGAPRGARARCPIPPEVVLLDIGLPGMNGYEVARRTAAGGRRRQEEAVHRCSQSGYGSDEARRRAVEAGFNAHLLKPIDINELSQLLPYVCNVSYTVRFTAQRGACS